MHESREGSSAFVFDLMEPERPKVIRSDGVCRLNPEMARCVAQVVYGVVGVIERLPRNMGRGLATICLFERSVLGAIIKDRFGWKRLCESCHKKVDNQRHSKRRIRSERCGGFVSSTTFNQSRASADRCGCFSLVAFTRKARRRVFPWIASLSLLICIVIQGAHVGLIEVLFVLGIKIVADIGEFEAGSRALRDHIHAIQITDAIIVDHGRDSLLGDRKGPSLDIAPFGCQA
jgi:hypothetical protein